MIKVTILNKFLFVVFVFVFVFVSIVPLHPVQANIGDYDDHWKARELEAKENAAKAYHTDPHELCHDFHKEVRKYVIIHLSFLTMPGPVLYRT